MSNAYTHCIKNRCCHGLAVLLSICFISACTPDAPPAVRPPSGLVYAGHGDAIKGKDLYADECGKCHQLFAGGNRKGPQLLNIYGAKAATLADYTRYSNALKNSGWVWDDARLDAYIKNPKQSLPKGKMLYDGLDSLDQRADIIAYLATLR